MNSAMMNVRLLIAAKTQMTNGVCLGALTTTGENLRLIPPGEINWTFEDGAQFEIRQVWDMKVQRVSSVEPPHTEDVVVHQRTHDRTLTMEETATAIERVAEIDTGSHSALFDRLLRWTFAGSLYISEADVLNYSVGLWRPDEPLTRFAIGNGQRYRYPTSMGPVSFKFVGFQEPIETIPAGTLVRVSLARWWNPPDQEVEPRCYAQISGWYL